MAEKLIPLEHPGVFLKEEFLEPLGPPAYRVSKDTGIPNMALSKILRGMRPLYFPSDFKPIIVIYKLF